MRIRAMILALVVTVGLVVYLKERALRYHYDSDGSFIDIRLSELDSLERLKEAFQNMLNNRGANSPFTIRQMTNGPSLFTFVQCYNCPRGIPMFSVFCYQRGSLGSLVLRAYVPVNDFFYTDTPGKDLLGQPVKIFNDGEFTKVIYRNSTIFSISTNWIRK